MLKKNNIKINFGVFEKEFKVGNIENMYIGVAEYKGLPQPALFIKCLDGLYQLIIKEGYQIYNANIILKRLNTYNEIKFENYQQYTGLVEKVFNDFKNR